MSGSSIVSSDSAYFRVSIESVRKIFAQDEEHPSEEADWHAQWRKTNQPRADKLRRALEVDFAPLVKEYGLVPYNADYPEVIEGSEDDAPAIVESKNPFQYLLRFDDVTVRVAFKELPPPAPRRALKQQLRTWFAQGSEQTR